MEETRTILVPLVMFGWIPAVLVLFATQPARRAICCAYLIGWQFLPIATYELRGLPDYDKLAATNLLIFLAAAIFDFKRLIAFRPHWLDLPVAVVCLVPIASSLSNGLGWYDGVSAAFVEGVRWGLPYVLGRVYFSDWEGLRALALTIVIGGLIYVPLALFEIIIGPELHHLLYGYYQQAVRQSYRFGGWRPPIFMTHGLMVGVWFMAATLTALWLWKTDTLRRLGPLPIAWAGTALLITSVLAKSLNAWLLLAAGLGVLMLQRWRMVTALLWLALLAIPIYLGLRATQTWSAQQVADVVGEYVSPERGWSVNFRFENEVMLAEKARQRPIFGWAGWGRQQVYTYGGARLTVTDSLWIVVFGKYGTVGLVSVFTLLLLPTALFLRRYPVSQWSAPRLAPAAVLSLILLLYSVDNLFNAMINPIYTLAAGGLVGLYLYEQ